MTFPDSVTFGGRVYVPKPSGGIALPPGQYARILHDDEANDGKFRIRAPEVWPLYWVEYTELTQAWQWFFFRVGLVHPYTGYKHWDETKLTASELEMLKREWRSLTHGAKAFTNNAGTELYRDYISGKNMGAGLPAQGAITCCGNIVKIVGNATFKGTPIETLDGTKPPPPIEKVNRIATPWLVFCAVNIPGYVEGGKEFPQYVTVDGKKRVKADPFPNLEPKDTCVPLRSNGNKTGNRYTRDGINLCVNYIRSSRLARVTSVPRPYVP
jgi:hypothetical protein